MFDHQTMVNEQFWNVFST